MGDIIIQLIQAPRSEGYISNSRSACYVPLGLISIATYCREVFPQASIEVLDGELLTLEEIIARLKPGALIGIETKLYNYATALKIARAANELDCVVVLGGVYASALPELIIRNQGDIVDYVVVGYGEIPITQIIQGETGRISRQPRIIRNPQPGFNELPMADRGAFVDPQQYFRNFRASHPTWSHHTVANINTGQGCQYRCVFCSRLSTGLGCVWHKDPRLVWQEISHLNSEYGVDYVVAFDEQIAQDLGWLADLVRCKPADLSVGWHVFLNADSVNDSCVELLKKLGVVHAFIGVETGDPVIARAVGKGRSFSPVQTITAFMMLNAVGISITPSFVIGLPGETASSLLNTFELATLIHDVVSFEEVFAACLVPFPGSRAFTMLIQDCPDLRGQDVVDGEALTKLWLERFTEVSYEMAREYVKKILDLGSYTITLDKRGY